MAGGPRRGAGRGRIKCRARGPRRGRAPAQVLSGRHGGRSRRRGRRDGAPRGLRRSYDLGGLRRAAHASAARSDYTRALAALARCTAALAPVLERCEAGAADDDDWAAARGLRARRRRRRRACRHKNGGRAGRARIAATARASERRACRDAVAAFYDDATDAPAKQSEADDDVLVDDAADDRRGAFHAAHCVPGLCGNQPCHRCFTRRLKTNAPYI